MTSDQPFLRVRYHRPQPGIIECGVLGEIDLVTAPALADALDRVDQRDAHLVLVDLSQVALLSAAGLRVLRTAAGRARARGHRFVVVASGTAQRTLAITEIDQEIPCYPCRCSAIRANAVVGQPWLGTCHIDLNERADPAERGLRRYVHQIAIGLDVGPEGVWCEVADRASAYLALPAPLGTAPGSDIALVWDGGVGWAAGIETGHGADPEVRAWYGDDPVPEPEDVIAFTKSVLAGQPAGQPTPPVPHDVARLRDRLTRFLAG